MRYFIIHNFCAWLLLLSVHHANSQNVQLQFENRVLSPDHLTWTFDLKAKADLQSGYLQSGGKWRAFNIRLNLDLPSGVTITSGTGTADDSLSTGFASVGTIAPGEPVAGQQALSLSITRTTQKDLSTSEFIKLATYIIHFSAPVNPNSIVTPRQAAETTGSSWSNLSQGDLRRPFSMENTFPLKMNLLPVKLIRFSAEKQENTAVLTWATSEEIGADRFDLQRSENGKTWTTINSTPAKGDSKSEAIYKVIDDNPNAGTNLYRLHMIDKDGSNSYSSLQNVTFDFEPIYLFPNPVSDFLIIKTDNSFSIEEITFFDMNGARVFRSNLVDNKKVDVRNLKPGMYIAKLKKSKGQESTYKIMINR